MARVYIPTLLRELSGGRAEVDVPGATVDEVVAGLDAACPGIAGRLMDAGRLRANVSVAVDGEIAPLGLLERVGPDSEVHFVTAIKGGVL